MNKPAFVRNLHMYMLLLFMRKHLYNIESDFEVLQFTYKKKKHFKWFLSSFGYGCLARASSSATDVRFIRSNQMQCGQYSPPRNVGMSSKNDAASVSLL